MTIRNIIRFRPILVRLLAREKRGRPLTAEEISNRSGLPLVVVEVLSRSLSWDNVDIFTMLKFCRGCNLDLEKPDEIKRATEYLRAQRKIRPAGRFKYLRRSGNWHAYYLPLMIKWMHEESRRKMSLRGMEGRHELEHIRD